MRPDAAAAPVRHHVIIPAAGLGRRMGDGAALPKSLRPVAGRPILLRALDALATRAVSGVTLIVGHGGEAILRSVGDRYRGMPVRYVLNEDHATTEHGWSVFLARDAWRSEPLPVLFMDADNVFDPLLLDRLLAPGPENRVLVDPGLETEERDEELVVGREGRVTGFVRGRAGAVADCVGGFVGMNRFSPRFMQVLFDYMEGFFPEHGRGFKYERIFDRVVRQTDLRVHYLPTGGLAWVNVNHLQELIDAERIARGEPVR